MTKGELHAKSAIWGLMATLLIVAVNIVWGGPRCRYETPHYFIETDLPLQGVREVAVRLNCMYEEYVRVAKNYCGKIDDRQLCRVVSNERDYIACGGRPNSGGWYDPGRKQLCVFANPAWGKKFLWEGIQHEGFHQFACSGKFDYKAPVWIHEGLAEYFGYGIWTGGSIKTGIISTRPLERIKFYITHNKLMPFDKFMAMGQSEWNGCAGDVQRRNYDQAWSMIHFLLSAEDGKYKHAFDLFVDDLTTRTVERKGSKTWKDAWKSRFGDDVGAFQAVYAKWWMALPNDPTKDIVTAAKVETLMNYLARAFVKGQTFQTCQEFFDTANKGKITLQEDINYWLPADLLKEMAQDAMRLKGWSLQKDQEGNPKLVLQEGGRTYIGTFTCRKDGPPLVQVQSLPSAKSR